MHTLSLHNMHIRLNTTMNNANKRTTVGASEKQDDNDNDGDGDDDGDAGKSKIRFLYGIACCC